MTGGIIGVILTAWISLGSSFSKTLKQEPWLPLAPTDMCCLNKNVTTSIENMDMSQLIIGATDFMTSQSDLMTHTTESISDYMGYTPYVVIYSCII